MLCFLFDTPTENQSFSDFSHRDILKEPKAMCWLPAFNWRTHPLIPSCEFNSWPEKVEKWPHGTAWEMQCPETWIYPFPYHGLTIRAYLKCATQKVMKIYNDANRSELALTPALIIPGL